MSKQVRLEDLKKTTKSVKKYIDSTVGTETLSTDAKTLKGAINELFQDVSNGKSLIASAITDKGIITSEMDTFATMASNIRSITDVEGQIVSINGNNYILHKGADDNITAEKVPNIYVVNNTLYYCSNSNTNVKVAEGSSYSATLIPTTGYELGVINVTMGGVAVSSTCISGNKITIPNITGDISISCTATKIPYTITNNLSNCSNSNSSKSITENASYSATLTASSGYELGVISVTMGGVPVSSTYISNGKITIPKVTGNIVISCTANRLPCTVTNTLTYCSSNNISSSVAYDGSYSATLTPIDGYEINNISVTMGGSEVSPLYVSNNIINIPNVTGDLVITCVAEKAPYKVTYNLSNCTSSNTAETVREGESYKATITAMDGYTLGAITATMGGKALSGTSVYRNKISISKVTGDIVITCAATDPNANNHTITNNLTNCKNNNAMTTISDGSSYSATITPNDGYEISSLTVTMGGQPISGTSIIGNKISISKVTGDIIITAATTKAPYMITNNLLHCTSNNELSSIAEGASYSATITADNGYRLGTLTVTMGGQTLGGTYVSNGKITIPKVTGNIVISCTGVISGTYSVTYNLSNCTSNNIATSVNENESYIATLTPNSGYRLGTITATMGGQTLGGTSVYNGKVSVSKVTGDIIINCSAELIPTTYTVTSNLVNATTSNSATSIGEGESYTATITPNDGFKNGTLTATMGGVAIGGTSIVGNTIRISKVTGDLIITYSAPSASTTSISCSTISLSKSSLSFSTKSTEMIYAILNPQNATSNVVWAIGNQNVAKITTNGRICYVTAVGDGYTAVSASCGTKRYTCGVTVALETPSYTVTNSLSHCSTTNSASSVKEGESYSATITADSGYLLSKLIVTMNGNDITSTVVSDSTINITSVTGNISISCTTIIDTGKKVKLLISNEGTKGTTTEQSTGTLLDKIEPLMNKDNKDVLETVMFDEVEAASVEGDTSNFYTLNYNTNSYEQKSFTLQSKGTHCQVWVNNGRMNKSNTDLIVNEFDNVIYDLITTNFGNIPDVNGDGMVNIMVYSIVGDGTIGYFNSIDFTMGGANSNKGQYIYIASSYAPDCYTTIVHEMQHMVNFYRSTKIENYTKMPVWIDEGLSVSSEQIYTGNIITSRVNYYNKNEDIKNGHSLIVWDQDKSLANYSLSYLFMQYVKIQCGIGDPVFKEIINGSKNDYRDIEAVVQKYVSATMPFGKFMSYFRMALVLNEPTGLRGFKGDPIGELINTQLYTGKTTGLKDGGAIVMEVPENFEVPNDGGSDIKYYFL